MGITTIIIIALGLSMDAFAVSVTNGIAIKNIKMKDILKMGIVFGGFQAVMPLAGWLIGFRLSEFITRYDHWIAFILLGSLGAKMIYDAIKERKKHVEKNDGNRDIESNALDNKVLILLAVATSIDALAVGISMAFLKVSILKAVFIIGIVTFIMSVTGANTGKRFGHIFQHKAKIIGGIILIIIGIRIFMEHLDILSVFGF
jgi:manganese efflux pump family protein